MTVGKKVKCVFCGKRLTITKNGKMRRHTSPNQSLFVYKAPVCYGSFTRNYEWVEKS
jgi:hypothetical protein